MDARTNNTKGQGPWVSIIKSKCKQKSDSRQSEPADMASSQIRFYPATYSLFARDYQLATTFSELMWEHAIQNAQQVTEDGKSSFKF